MKKLMLLCLALLAAYAVPAAPSLTVTNLTCRQRYPWNGKVDIDFDVQCGDPSTNVTLYVAARDVQHARLLSVKTLSCADNVSTNAEELAVKAGRHRIVWDFGTDNPNVVSTNVVVDVQGLFGSRTYLVIDLHAGATAGSYPYYYLAGAPTGGWTDEYKTERLVLRRIKPGSFTFGSPTDEVGRQENEDARTVTLSSAFYLGVFEVTQRQWELVMGSNASYFRGVDGAETHPVEQVSYDAIRGSTNGAGWPTSSAVDAGSFLGLLRAKTGLTDLDLPTEAQWEYACRAGTTTALNNGEDLLCEDSDVALDELGCYWFTTEGGPSSVGSYLPNAWGLYDMHGNVWEWCLDWWSASPTETLNPSGAASGSKRSIRGGGWNNDAYLCRAACRFYSYKPAQTGYNLGFRLCRTPRP